MADAEYKRLSLGARLFPQLVPHCSVEGCEGKHYGNGLCNKHYQKNRKYGSPLGVAVRKSKLAPTCQIEGCERKSRSRWQMGISVCAMHYLRRMQTGSFDDPFADRSPDGVCIANGCTVDARSSTAQYCERHYYQIRRTGSVATKVVGGEVVVADLPSYSECQYCGTASNGRMYCGARCRARSTRGVERLSNCASCNVIFEPISGSACCSSECRYALDRKLRNDWFKNRMSNDPAFVAKVRDAGHRRRARKVSAYVEDVDRDFVMARDKWICHLCGDKIPKNAKWPSGLFGTLEHVVPLASGGAHSYNNIKAAHLSCNCKKGSKTVGQLGLSF